VSIDGQTIGSAESLSVTHSVVLEPVSVGAPQMRHSHGGSWKRAKTRKINCFSQILRNRGFMDCVHTAGDLR